MPFSWVKVSGHTSRKLRDCIGDDHSRVHARQCIATLVEKAGGRSDQVWFELNGKYARVMIEWPTPEEKAKIILDLEAEDVVDVFGPEEIDALAAERYSAD
jgi:hypothetical protein